MKSQEFRRKGATTMDDELREYELIQQIAAPILEQLLELSEQAGTEEVNIPVAFSLSAEYSTIPSDGSIEYDLDDEDFLYHNEEFLASLNEYIQAQVEQWNRPTGLLQ